MNAHLCNLNDPTSFIKFTAPLGLACDTNRVHERVAMLVLNDYIRKALSNILNKRMCTVEKWSLIPSSVRDSDCGTKGSSRVTRKWSLKFIPSHTLSTKIFLTHDYQIIIQPPTCLLGHLIRMTCIKAYLKPLVPTINLRMILSMEPVTYRYTVD